MNSIENSDINSIVPENRKKNPHAVALGRQGGKAGRGASKARKITSEAARKAAQKRWAKK